MATKKTAAKKVEAKEKKVAPAVQNVPKVVTVNIGEQSMTGEFREFKSGSKGWYLGGKVYINGTKCQMSCSIVIVGSKPEKKKEKK